MAAGAAFDFEAWLILALREGALAEVQLVPPAMGPRDGTGLSYSSDSGTKGRNSINFTRCQNDESGSSVSTISFSPS